MPTVLDRSALEQSPLADLHLLANELGVDGFRRLRKPDLVDAILDAPGRRGRTRGRGRRGRARGRGRSPGGRESATTTARSARAAAGAVGAAGAATRTRAARWSTATSPLPRLPPLRRPRRRSTVAGTVELLANGSGFLRLTPPEETDQDVYISAAQVKRCELVSGDKISGPMRPARRSERFPSLIRVETINGRPAEEVAEGTRFEDLPVAWPDERIELGSADPTVRAIEWLTPFGKGSRVVITGASRSGKSEALRRLAGALAARPGLEVSAVLTGVRPEEALDFPVAPSSVLSFASSTDAQAQAVEQAVETGRRVAARGGDAVVLIDGFEYLPASAARRALAAGRNLDGGGSLTVIATSPAPVGGETTVVALDRAAAAAGTFPALALSESGTLRPELLVGEAGAEPRCAPRSRGGDLTPPPLPEPVAAPEPVIVEPEAVAGPEAPLSDAELVAEPAPKPKRKRPARKPRGGREEAGRGGEEARAAAKKPAAAAKKPAAAAKKPAARRRRRSPRRPRRSPPRPRRSPRPRPRRSRRPRSASRRPRSRRPVARCGARRRSSWCSPPRRSPRPPTRSWAASPWRRAPCRGSRRCQGCGGTLVAPDRIVTAGHCVRGVSAGELKRDPRRRRGAQRRALRDASRLAAHQRRQRARRRRDHPARPAGPERRAGAARRRRGAADDRARARCHRATTSPAPARCARRA